jgi:hypothetical protein
MGCGLAGWPGANQSRTWCQDKVLLQFVGLVCSSVNVVMGVIKHPWSWSLSVITSLVIIPLVGVV